MAWKNMLNEANILITSEFVCQLEHEQIHVNLQLGTTEQNNKTGSTRQTETDS